MTTKEFDYMNALDKIIRLMVEDMATYNELKKIAERISNGENVDDSEILQVLNN